MTGQDEERLAELAVATIEGAEVHVFDGFTAVVLPPLTADGSAVLTSVGIGAAAVFVDHGVGW